MAYEIATALVPVFFVLALGYGAGRFRLIDNTDVTSLDTLVMSFALPIALFTSLAGSRRSEVVARWQLVAISAVVMGLIYAGVYLLQHRFYRATPSASAIQALTVAFPNGAAVALPLAGAVLGPSATLGVAAVLAVGSVTLSPVTLVILERHRTAAGGAGMGHVILSSLRKPIVIGPALGAAWSLLGIPLPQLAAVTLTTIGAITAGAALFLTGLVVSGQKIDFTANAYVSTFITIVVRPALAFAVILAAGLSGPLARETLLLQAVPAGFFGILLGVAYHEKSPLAGTTVLFSTVLSAITLTTLIALLPRL